MITVIKYGAWDILHVGHLNALEFSATLGDRLVVGIATDEYIEEYKGRAPLMSYHDRARIVKALRVVNETVPYNGPGDLIPVQLFDASIAVVDEWYGVGDAPHAKRQRIAIQQLNSAGVQVVRYPRTPNISSSYMKGQK